MAVEFMWDGNTFFMWDGNTFLWNSLIYICKGSVILEVDIFFLKFHTPPPPPPPPPENQLVHPLVVILVKIPVHILVKCVQHRLSVIVNSGRGQS